MKPIGGTKCVAGVLGFLLLFLVVGGGQAASIDVSSWNLTVDLGDQWHTSDPHAVENDDTHGLDAASAYTWKGIRLVDAFWLPKKGAVLNLKDLPSIMNPNQDDLLATVDIRVHRVPALFDSVSQGAYNTLHEFSGFWRNQDQGGSEKEIEFNGKPAVLGEIDFDYVKNVSPKCSVGTICIMMTDDTIVTLDVTTLSDSGLRAWDVIEKFAISPK
jgi:hypothetical protein